MWFIQFFSTLSSPNYSMKQTIVSIRVHTYPILTITTIIYPRLDQHCTFRPYQPMTTPTPLEQSINFYNTLYISFLFCNIYHIKIILFHIVFPCSFPPKAPNEVNSHINPCPHLSHFGIRFHQFRSLFPRVHRIWFCNSFFNLPFFNF